MRINRIVFKIAKSGNSDAEYEDAFYPTQIAKENFDSQILRFAVADGATEGCLSVHWAHILVTRFCKTHDFELSTFLDGAYDSWNKYYSSYLRARTKRKPIQWFEEPSLNSGAFSTLLGIQFSESTEHGSGVLKAIAVGDSCLFHIRNQKIIAAFPIDASDMFSFRPVLFCSKRDLNTECFSKLKVYENEFYVDDQFYLVTDALAAWIMRQIENNSTSWQILGDFGTKDETTSFEHWVETQRKDRSMRNDDVTLMRLRID